ncbi:MAG: ABC transporter ATP-binding protein [Clostridiales bacterium]|nr:ABC transporter ATP-binding protein [Clostridiales bacterium]
MKYKDVFNLRDVFLPVHAVAKVPKSAYKAYFIFYVMLFMTSAFSHFYSFLLPLATNAVETGTVILGVVLFIMYHLKDIVSNVLYTISRYFAQKNGEILGIDLARHSVNITSKVSGKIIFENKNISNSTIMTNVGQYISMYRETCESFVNMCISLVTFLVSVIGSIYVAVAKFDNVLLFAGTMIGAVIVTSYFAYKRTMNSQEYYSKESELNRKRESEKNDCINMKVISKSHSDFMLSNYLTTLKELAKYRLKHGVKTNAVQIKNSAIFSIAIILVVIDSIIAVGINNLNATNFLSIISLATVFASILSSVNSQIGIINTFFCLKSEFSKEKMLFAEIMRVYDGEPEEKEVEGDINLAPFEFSYAGANFTLESKRRLCFKRGEMVLVVGESGAGKSTLLKILSGKIRLNNNPKICSVYSPSGGELGCQSLLDEITLGHLQYEKLIEILKGSCIYDELVEKSEGKDLIEYMSCIGTTDFSDGQKQRLRLARALYNLDKCSLVILDEPIANVDKDKAHRMLVFAKEYASRKMNKIVIVTTHQFDGEEEQFDQLLEVKKEGSESIIF